jgi:hypothetical protein
MAAGKFRFDPEVYLKSIAIPAWTKMRDEIAVSVVLMIHTKTNSRDIPPRFTKRVGLRLDEVIIFGLCKR